MNSFEVLIQKWGAEARQLDDAAKQEDIGAEEADLNKYCSEQLRKCIRDLEAVMGHPDNASPAVKRAADFFNAKAAQYDHECHTIFGATCDICGKKNEVPWRKTKCPSCQRMFADGETCSRGGCPMGGDV